MLGSTDSLIPLVVAGISGAIAVASLAWQASTHRKDRQFERETREEERRIEADRLVRKYRNPLVFAADELRSRVRNITGERFLERYGKSEYVIVSTSFVIAELLCWMEIVRQEMQFLDLGDVDQTRRLNQAIYSIGRCLATDRLRGVDGQTALFMLWRQEQRAIGEQMIDRSAGVARCIGYAAFEERRGEFEGRPWFRRLFDDAQALAHAQTLAFPRLPKLRDAAVELIRVLDPIGILVPELSPDVAGGED